MEVLQGYVRDADMFRDHVVPGCCDGRSRPWNCSNARVAAKPR